MRAPLTVTPRLQAPRYVFPVVGSVSYGDTYGGFRGDVPGNWHHGDDIFAAVGTPVVAVADGTLNRVGWQRLGGWRLWVRDRMRNEFYYAHLSGYSPLALHSRYVKAGDVIGFIGNTGDAFTTPPHLHFEIHPLPLLRLDYNGAVNPTRYVAAWRACRAPADADARAPAFPPGPVRPRRGTCGASCSLRGADLARAEAEREPADRIARPDRAPQGDDWPPPPLSPPRAASPTAILLDVVVGLAAPALLFGAALSVSGGGRRDRRRSTSRAAPRSGRSPDRACARCCSARPRTCWATASRIRTSPAAASRSPAASPASASWRRGAALSTPRRSAGSPRRRPISSTSSRRSGRAGGSSSTADSAGIASGNFPANVQLLLAGAIVGYLLGSRD